MSEPVIALAHGRTPNGEWIPLRVDVHGRLRCHIHIPKDQRIVEVERIVEIVVDEEP